MTRLRPAAALALAVAAALATGAALAPADADTPPAPPLPERAGAIPEGVYHGVLAWPHGTYRFQADPTSLQGQWSLRAGRVDLSVTGTTVEGDWSFELTAQGRGTSSRGRSGSAEGTATGRGVLQGPSRGPCMSGSLDLRATMWIGDDAGIVEVPVNEAVPLACENFEWTIAAATCRTVTGEWTLPFTGGLAQGGASVPSDGTFMIWRVGDVTTVEAEREQVAEFVAEIERIMQTEPFEHWSLTHLLRRVAEFEGNNARNTACGQRDHRYTRLVGGHLMRLLLDRLLPNEPVDFTTLRWMAYAALNTGQLGSGAYQPALAEFLAAEFRRDLDQLIEQAEAAGLETRLVAMETFARQYGWHDTARRAGEAYERVRGGS